MSVPAGTEAAAGRSRPPWVVGMLMIALLGALLWFAPQGYERLQSAWFDTYQVLIPRSVEDTRVTVVEIDDESLTALGQWPWPRTVLAELVRAIARHHPAAIGIDIVMPEADRLSPQQLARRIREYEPALASRVAALPSPARELRHAPAHYPGAAALARHRGQTVEAPQGALPAADAETLDKVLEAIDIECIGWMSGQRRHPAHAAGVRYRRHACSRLCGGDTSRRVRRA